MRIDPESLKRLVGAIFAAAGCQSPEPERIAGYLVEANLVGHDSHGGIRGGAHILRGRDGRVLANRTLRVVFEHNWIVVVDGCFVFGVIMGEVSILIVIEKSARHGV